MKEQNTITPADQPGYEPSPAPDVDAPVDVHDSHDWILLPRWNECKRCRVRDYWPGAAEACPNTGKKPGKKDPEIVPVSLSAALTILSRDVIAFGVWWLGRDLGDLRPTIEEWAAEFFEWRRAGSALG
jgi:hypothetical protein